MLIEPISELKNYNNLLDKVKDGDPIYLTKNGKGAFAIFSISDAENFSKYKINEQFNNDIKGTIENESFFVKDLEAFYKEINEADKESIKNKKLYSDEVFEEIRSSINA